MVRTFSKSLMLRVGIEFPFFDHSWLGGVSAIRNLVNAFRYLEKPKVELVLVAGGRTPDILLAGMRDVRTVRTNLIDPAHWASLPGRALRRSVGRNIPLELWLRSRGIQVYSHCAPLGLRAAMPTIGHIADFGYKYFKDLYPDDVFANKDAGTARICNEFDMLLLSSRSAEADYQRFFPDASAKSAVLNIVPTSIPEQESTLDQLVARYQIPHRYIHSPNQFWVHKNHVAIVEALAIAKAKGHDIHVVCNGGTLDERRPCHFEATIDRARTLGVDDRFHVLGIIPYQDAIDLMRHSMAVLSASLFEGWGISITEAKMLGKTILLSDIPVFREQAPERASYFDPDDHEELAARLIATQEGYSETADRAAAALQRERWPLLARHYAAGFEQIAIAAADLRNSCRVRL